MNSEENRQKASITGESSTGLDKEAFTEIIRSASEIVKTIKKPLSKEDAAEYFRDMDLSDAQQELVYKYLRNVQEEDNETGRKAKSETEEHAENDPAELKEGRSDPQFFQMYLKDVADIRACTPQEEEMLYVQLAEGDQSAVKKLSDQWHLRVIETARKLEVSAKEMQDVIQEGNMGILLALNELAGSGRKNGFKRILEEAAKNAMQAYLVGQAAAEDLDQSLIAKVSLVYEAQKFLAEELLRVPSAEELSQYTKMPIEEIEDTLAMLKEKE